MPKDLTSCNYSLTLDEDWHLQEALRAVHCCVQYCGSLRSGKHFGLLSGDNCMLNTDLLFPFAQLIS